MFVRFHSATGRLQCALVETRRVNGKVRQEHIAALGSVPVPPAVADRVTFWKKLHERLAKLANRVGAEDQAKIMGAIHARIPMVMVPEQQGLQLENIEADQRFWNSMRENWEEQVAGKKAIVAKLERDIAEAQTEAARASEHVANAQARIERLQKGEPVEGGLSRIDAVALLRAQGWTASDFRHMDRLGSLDEAEVKQYLDDVTDAGDIDRRERAVVRAILRARRHRQGHQ